MTTKNVLLLAIIALLVSVNLKATKYVIGEIEPCMTEFYGCPYIGPNVLAVESNYSPDCTFLIEFYYRECGGTLDIQIVAIYRGEPKWGQQDFVKCLWVNSDESLTWHYAFMEVYLFLTADEELKNLQQHFTTQKSCYRTTGPTLEEIAAPGYIFRADTLTVPDTVAFFDFSNLYDLDGDLTNNLVIFNAIITCESSCCCFELDRIYDSTDVLQSVWTGDPCLNLPVECPEGCYGGCEQMQFGWMKDYGFVYKYNIDFDNPVKSSILIKPNPNNGIFDISVSNEEVGNLIITVFDLNGKEVFTDVAMKNNKGFDTKLTLDVATGEYFIYFKINDRFVGLEKIIINK